jgi:release factor glutamine methyltransferase
MSQVYSPEEDSYLMQKTLEKNIKNKNLNVLEIGIGSGIQLKTLKKLGIKNLSGVDINSDAVKDCKKLGFNCKISNLFEKVKGEFDIIIFNPPYLPEDKKEPKDSQLATTGGKKGGELINKFLRQAKKHLNKKGKIFLLVSSLTKGLNYEGYKKNKIAEKKLFMEKLEILELTI